MEYGCATGRIERVEFLILIPRIFTPELKRYALFAHKQAQLAAERAKGELMEAPHADFSCLIARSASTVRNQDLLLFV